MTAGCGDTGLRIAINKLTDDNPFTGVAELMASISRGEEDIGSASSAFPVSELDLGSVSRGKITLKLNGYNAEGAVVALGLEEFTAPGRGEDCCVLACFCSSARYDAGDCDCGSNACTPTCSTQ